MEPNLLLHHVRRFVFPEELLASLADQVLVQWTSKSRQECLLSGLQAYRLRVKDATTSQWLDQWISRAQWSQSSSSLAPLIDNGDDWRKLSTCNYAKDEILRLCDPRRRIRLSHHLLCAGLFDKEIRALTGDDVHPLTLPDKLRCHFHLLRRNSYHQGAYYSSDHHREVDANGRARLLQDWTTPPDTNKEKNPHRVGDEVIVTQNVRDFKESTRSGWMAAWRRQNPRQRVLAWCILETHVHTVEEAAQMSAQWIRLWGQHLKPGAPPLSYWSTSSSRPAGVAILLTPHSAVHSSECHQDRCSPRALSVSIGDILLFNLYAPTLRPISEAFFTSLLSWNLEPINTIIAGEFNRVQSPFLDRAGHHRSNRLESPALDTVITRIGLTDARVLRDHADDDTTDDLVDHFTYIEGARASRIDQFYVPAIWVDRVQWFDTRVPFQHSDHQEVILCLRDTSRPRRHLWSRAVAYPIQLSRPTQVIDELVKDMDGMAIGQAASTLTWDVEVAECKRCIRRVSKRVKQRRARLRHNSKHRTQRQLFSRPQWISRNIEDLRKEHLGRLGQNLIRSTDRLRWIHNQVSDWERDQHVTTIRQQHGPAFTRNISIADKFTSEWSSVLGVIHRKQPLHGLNAAIQKFVHIPTERSYFEGSQRGSLS